jgi:hypothetical protein
MVREGERAFLKKASDERGTMNDELIVNFEF